LEVRAPAGYFRCGLAGRRACWARDRL